VAAYQNGDHREAIALCRLATRDGIDAGFVYYYWGASLLELNRDFEAFARFDDAAERDPEQRRLGARLLADKGIEDAENRQRARAAKRLRKAQELDPAIDLGATVFLVADECFAEKDFARAALLYTKAVEAFPDTSVCEEAYFNLSFSRVALGDTVRAMEVLQTLLEHFPRGQFKGDATFRLESMLFDKAQKDYRAGNYEDAILTAEDLVLRTKNTGLTLKSQYLLGEIHEAQGDYDAAYRAYREVIRGDLGASGRIVQSAREKMDAIREAGLH